MVMALPGKAGPSFGHHQPLSPGGKGMVYYAVVRGSRTFPCVRLRTTVSVMDLEKLLVVGLALDNYSPPIHLQTGAAGIEHHIGLAFLAPSSSPSPWEPGVVCGPLYAESRRKR